jgi:hypothetical protein
VSNPKPDTPASALTPGDRWDWLLEIPWGVIVFLLLVVVGVLCGPSSPQNSGQAIT